MRSSPLAPRSCTTIPAAHPERVRLARLLVALVALLAPALGATSVLPAAGAAPSAGTADPGPVGVWPLAPAPTVVHGFDPPDCIWCAGHRGVDLAGVVLEPVRAVLPGTVTYAGALAGRGVVVVDHGAFRTTYEPVAPVVRRGENVAGGTLLGRLESVGSHCFPAACLHLGLVRDADDAYLDPLAILPAVLQPVRLLPLWDATTTAPTSRLTLGASPLDAPVETPGIGPGRGPVAMRTRAQGLPLL